MKKFPVKNISRNVFSHTAGQALSIILNLLSFGLAARFLGVENFGVFSYVLAVVIIATKLIDFGIAPVILRECSVEKNFVLLNTGILLRFLAFILLIIIFNFFALYNFSKTEIIISNLLLFNLIISSKGFVRELLELPFKVDLKVHIPVVIFLIDNLVFLVLVILTPLFRGGLLYFVFAYVFSNMPGFIIMMFMVKRDYNFTLSSNLKSVKWLVKNSLPVFSYVVFIALFQQVDLLLLNYLDSSYVTGIYSAANRLMIPMLIIPTAIIYTVLPIIANNHSSDPSLNIPIIRFVFKVFFYISFSLAIIIFFKSQTVAVTIYGNNFKDSGSPLAILFFSQVFLFYSFFVINLLVIYDKQNAIFIYSIVVLIIEIILDFILIPIFSFNGAAYAKLIAIFCGFIVTAHIIYKYDNSLYLNEMNNLFFSITVFFLCYLLSFLNFVLYLFLTILTIIIFTFFLRYFSPTEIRFLLKMVNKEKLAENYYLSKFLN